MGFLVAMAMTLAFGFVASASAEPIKIGVIKQSNAAPVFIAAEKGYFAGEGLEATIVYFDAAQPIAVATASGDLDFGAAGLTAGFYNLAAQGVLRMIASQMFEVPGFQNFAVVASNRAYDAGLKSMKDLSGRSVAVSQMGSALHYSLAMVAEKNGVDLATIRVMALQANANISSALAGGQTDAAVFPATPTMALVAKDNAKLIGWVGDEAPFLQLGAAVTATKTADARGATVERFVKAYRKATQDYHAAFTGADGKRHDEATAAELVAIIAKYTGEPPERTRQGLAYFDGEARVDAADIKKQLAWYKAQGMLKGELAAEDLIDRRYAGLLPH